MDKNYDNTYDHFILEVASYSPAKFTDQELIETFPEAKNIIPQKIDEYKDQRFKLIQAMNAFYQAVIQIAKANNYDDFFIWFWGYAYLKYFYAIKVVEIDKQLWRLYRQNKMLNFSKENKSYPQKIPLMN